MNAEQVNRIAAAVLYEGYLLYPYRPSVKSRQRWTFGGLLPESYCAAKRSGDASTMRAECLVRRSPDTAAGASPRLDVVVRFLHLVNRTGGEQQIGDWQEAIEREVRLEGLSLDALTAGPQRRHFAFPHEVRSEPPLTREQQAVNGSLTVSAAPTGVADCLRLTMLIANETPLDAAAERTRDDALLRCFASTHAVLSFPGGGSSGAAFLSMTDPPAACRAAADACRNVGAWPILLGDPGDADAMLCSPIILDDHPTLAPQSPGDLFDGCEIDEILSLRILTLTDEEKRQMRATDPRAAALLDRTEALTREQLISLHGTMRELRPLPLAAETNREGK